MKEYVLSSIIEIISGGTPKTNNLEYWNGDIGWLSVADFNNDERFVYFSEKTITQKGLNESNTKLLKQGDTIISARGTVGALAQIGKEMAFNQSCFGLRAKQDFITEDFLFYALKNYIKNFKAKSQGSVFETINLSSFDLMKLTIPDLKTQQAIAKVLSTLDQKIAINNQINAQLEQMAKTLYDYWFVQFDFPNEHGKPYKYSGGEMVYNDLLKREIPKGWEVKSLGEIISLERGVTYSKESVCSNHRNATGILRATNISGNVIDLNDLVFISDEIDNRQKLQPFDILIVMSSGSKEHIGKNGIYYFEQENAFGAFCSKIKPRNGYFEFVATFLQSSNFKSYIKNQCLGTNR